MTTTLIEAAKLARAHIVWFAFGECRSPGWEGEPPSANEAVSALDAALSASEATGEPASAASDFPPLPDPAFRLKWKDSRAGYFVDKPNIGDTDVFTSTEMYAYVLADRAARTPVEATSEQAITCKGTNCYAVNGIGHSSECIAEHDATVNAAVRADHIAHGGWKCHILRQLPEVSMNDRSMIPKLVEQARMAGIKFARALDYTELDVAGSEFNRSLDAIIDAASKPAVAVEAVVKRDDPWFGVQDEVALTRAVCVMDDVLTDIEGWEDQALANAIKESRMDLCAMVEFIRMRADGSYVPGTKPIDGNYTTQPPAPLKVCPLCGTLVSEASSSHACEDCKKKAPLKADMAGAASDTPDDSEIERWRSTADELLDCRSDNAGLTRRAAHLLQNAYLFCSSLITAQTSPLKADDAGKVVGLSDEQVEWVVNDNAELGVKIDQQFFWLYKGHSIVYKSGLHDDDSPMYWRPVFKREFGECCHPINYQDLNLIGTVSLDDSDQWIRLPPDLRNKGQK